jgi:hypothetical protein
VGRQRIAPAGSVPFCGVAQRPALPSECGA